MNNTAQPALSAPLSQVDYGHEVEKIWLHNDGSFIVMNYNKGLRESTIIHTDIDARGADGHWDYMIVRKCAIGSVPSSEELSEMNKYANFWLFTSQKEAEAQVAKLLG